MAVHETHSFTNVDPSILKQLRSIIGNEHVSNDPVDLETYAYDATKKRYPPAAVIWPETTEQISFVLKLATENRIPVYPRGGGTGLTGGALATQGGILLSLEHMDSIRSIQKQNRLVTTQTGIKLSDLKAAVQEQGLFYPPDPSSAKTATLGGTLAECAGGLNCVKYGTTKDWVQRIEAVLPTGEIVHFGSRTRKSVVSHHLLQLIVGSEGTLAIITEADLRLIPFPSHRATVVAMFDTVQDSAKAIQTIMDSGVTPCAIEFIDKECLTAANSYFPERSIPVAEALLLLECDAFDHQTVHDEIGILQDCCQKNNATQIIPAETDEERESLWQIRRSLSPAMYAKAPFKTNEDICVPLSQIPAMLEEAYAIGRKHNNIPLCFGHAGDGNIHVNFMSHHEKDDAVDQAVEELFQMVIQLGGSISGEHGIGLTKAPYLHYELGNNEQAIIQKVKATFDPANILNPSKILPATT